MINNSRLTALKVVFICDRNLDDIGGVESYYRNFVRHVDTLKTLGCRTTILTSEKSKTRLGENCEVIGLRGGGLYFKNFLRFLNPILRLAYCTHAIWHDLIKIRPDVILTRDYLMVIASRLTLRWGRVTIIFMPGSLVKMDLGMDRIYGEGSPIYTLSRGLQGQVFCFLERLGIRLADYVSVSTNVFKQNIFDNYSVSRKKIVRLPIGIDVKPFAIYRRDNSRYIGGIDLSKKKIILSVSRMVVSKNIYKVIDIVELLPKNFVWIVVGGGPELEPFRKYVQLRGLENQILALGPQFDVVPLYGSCDFFVHLSYYENFGQVLLEAMAAGIPPIALKSRNNDIKTANHEIIKDGYNGFLVEDNCAAIANKILALNQTDLTTTSKRAVDFATSRYSFDLHLGRLVALAKRQTKGGIGVEHSSFSNHPCL